MHIKMTNDYSYVFEQSIGQTIRNDAYNKITA